MLHKRRNDQFINYSDSYLISFEGIDAAGKTTQLNLLHNFLTIEKKIEVCVLSEFSGSIVGNLLLEQVIKNNFVILDPNVPMPFAETLLLISDFFVRQEFSAAHSNTFPITLADRHKDSLIAYQIPRIRNTYPNISEEYLFEWLLTCVEPIASPNLTFLLTLPIEDVITRIHQRESYTLTNYDKEFLEYAQQIFKGQKESQPIRFHEIDATQSIDQIFTQVIDIISQTLIKNNM